MKNNNKDALIALLWLIMGYIRWRTVLYFSFTFSFVTSVSTFLNETFHSKLTLDVMNSVLFYGTDLFSVFILVFLLSVITGKKRARLLLFLMGTEGYSLYGIIYVYFNSYAVLPSWIVSWLVKAVISYVIFTPLLAWIGAIWGHKYYERRNA